MDNLKQILKCIETLRIRLHHLIETKQDMLDDEVIKVSMDLDAALIEYYRILGKELFE